MKTKNNITKSIYVFILSAFFYVNVSAQTTSEEWTLAATKNNVSVYYKAGICSADSVVFIRIVNTNQHNTIVLWSLWDGEAVNEYALAGNTDLAGSCPDLQNKEVTTDLVDYIPSGKSSGDIIANIILE